MDELCILTVPSSDSEDADARPLEESSGLHSGLVWQLMGPWVIPVHGSVQTIFTERWCLCFDAV